MSHNRTLRYNNVTIVDTLCVDMVVMVARDLNGVPGGSAYIIMRVMVVMLLTGDRSAILLRF